MNHLTNFYKNKCEQLQEKVNILHYRLRQLNEVAEPPEDKPKPPQPNTPNADPVQEPVKPAPERRPMTDEEYERENPEPKVSDYDRNGDGVISDEEFRSYFEDYYRWRMAYLRWQMSQVPDPIPNDDGIDVVYNERIQRIMEQIRDLTRLLKSVQGDNRELDWDYWKEIWKTLFGKNSSGYNLEFARWMWEMMRRQRGWDIAPRDAPIIG